MTLDPNNAQNQGNATITESSTATFQQDVIDASASVPVLVDFWAPWCGPCKQLGPSIEKVVASFAGKVKLVKINVDENQALAGQMGVQSIPAVFAFAGGQPVDGFMGALPETQIHEFVQKVITATEGKLQPNEAQGPDIEKALEAAEQAAQVGNLPQAQQIFVAVLQHEPQNDRAILGLADLFLQADQIDDATAALEKISEDGKNLPTFNSLTLRLKLMSDASSLGAPDELRTRINADNTDYQAYIDLATVLNAKGERLESVTLLIDLMRLDRSWNDDAARLKLLELFEAWGPKEPATLKGRRALSALLFS